MSLCDDPQVSINQNVKYVVDVEDVSTDLIVSATDMSGGVYITSTSYEIGTRSFSAVICVPCCSVHGRTAAKSCLLSRQPTHLHRYLLAFLCDLLIHTGTDCRRVGCRGPADACDCSQ
jgi:hypothetical protein